MTTAADVYAEYETPGRVYTQDGVPLLTIAEAAEYVNERLPEGARWRNPEASLSYHRRSPHSKGGGGSGLLKAVEMVPPGVKEQRHRMKEKYGRTYVREPRRIVLFDPRELDKFLEKYEPSSRGRPQSVDLAPFKDRIGEIPDSLVAELAGCSERSVIRYRKKHGIKAPTRLTAEQVEAITKALNGVED